MSLLEITGAEVFEKLLNDDQKELIIKKWINTKEKAYKLYDIASKIKVDFDTLYVDSTDASVHINARGYRFVNIKIRRMYQEIHLSDEPPRHDLPSGHFGLRIRYPDNPELNDFKLVMMHKNCEIYSETSDPDIINDHESLEFYRITGCYGRDYQCGMHDLENPDSTYWHHW